MTSYKLPPAWLKLIVFLLILLGIGLRFVNLDRKSYWYDEAFTSLRISGYTQHERKQQILINPSLSVEDLRKYQSANNGKSAFDTIESLAKEEPHQLPLYYVLVHYWQHWFGDSIAATRSFSAILSVLLLPAVYWLCLELFESPRIGLMAMALIAISPVHIVYAQEARPYSLWVVTIILSSAALLRAIRLNTKRSWLIYTLTLLTGLYSHVYFGTVAISHAIYTLILKGLRWSEIPKGYLVSLLVGILLFALWPLYAIATFTPEGAVLSTGLESCLAGCNNILSLFNVWCTSFSRVFLDFGFMSMKHLSRDAPVLWVIVFLGLILEAYAIYFLWHRTPKRTWLFILTLIGTTAAFTILPDLILMSGRLSRATRYLLPMLVSVQLAIAYLLSIKTGYFSGESFQNRLWQFVTVIVFGVGIVSSVMSTQYSLWWNKGDLSKQKDYLEISKIINGTKRPLLISSLYSDPVIALTHHLDPKVHIQFLFGAKTSEIPHGFSDVFLLCPKKCSWLPSSRQGGSGTSVPGEMIYESADMPSSKRKSTWRLFRIQSP
jgi:uncharacterized membrane protein